MAHLLVSDYREINEDNYSNPVDYLRQPSSSHGSKLSRDQKSIEELYAQPISKRHASPQRPTHLELKGPLNRPAPAKAHLPESYSDNIARVIDPTYAQLQPHNGRRDYDDYPEDSNSPPSPLPPPYMPIQGTRRHQEGSALNAAREMVIPQNYSRMAGSGADQKGVGGGRGGGKKGKEKCAQQ